MGFRNSQSGSWPNRRPVSQPITSHGATLPAGIGRHSVYTLAANFTTNKKLRFPSDSEMALSQLSTALMLMEKKRFRKSRWLHASSS